MDGHCSLHGEVQLRSVGGGYWRCRVCSRNKDNEARHARKQLVVDMLGGSCERCGYDKCLDALQFHHRDPSTKEFELGKSKLRSYSIEKIMAEAAKCSLLCANCHLEEHSRKTEGRLGNS